MTKTLGLLISLAILVTSAAVVAQPTGGPNLASSIMAARQKSAALLVQYGWYVRTDISYGGTNQETRIQQVSYMPNGVAQYTMLNDTKAPLPRGFFRKAAQKSQDKDMDKFLAGVQQLIGQYTLPAPGAMFNFLSNATITNATDPFGNAILQTTGSGVVVPGDTLSINFDATTFAIKSMEITTSYDNHAVTMSATFRTLPSGLTHMQYATVNVPDKAYVVQIHNYDYMAND